MKRFAPREFAFLCAPLVLIGVGVIVARVLHPPRQAPKLDLFAGPIWSSAPKYNNRQAQDFGWMGCITDEEEKPRKVGYRASLFGSRPGQAPVLLYSSSAPLPPASSSTMAPAQIGGQKVFVMPPVYWGEQKVFLGTSLTVDKIPPGVQSLEWKLDVVAAPMSMPAPSSTRTPVSQYAVPSDILQDWARLPGALHVQKRFTSQLTGQELDPILICFADNQLSASYHGKIRAVTQIRGDRSRLFRRLEAFDGKAHRLLWKDGAPDSPTVNSSYIVGEHWGGGASMSSDGMTWNNSQNGLELDLRSVPTSWGRITLQVEAVADPQIGRIGKADNQSCDQSTFQQLKARGWAYGTRTVVLRDEAARKASRQKMKNLFIRNSSLPPE